MKTPAVLNVLSNAERLDMFINTASIIPPMQT